MDDRLIRDHRASSRSRNRGRRSMEVDGKVAKALVRVNVIGVVGDVRRDMEGHHYAERCSVFGVDREELEALHR